MNQNFNKELVVVPSTKVYDLERGIVSAGDVTVGTTYDWWGNPYDFTVAPVEDGKLWALNGQLFVAEGSRVPLHGMMPARKWFLKARDDEQARREMFAECFELDETGHPTLVCETVEQFIALVDLLPFYGVTVDADVNALKIYIDRNRPMCFFNKSLGFQTNQLVDIMWYWASGGWFHTLKPIDERLVEDIYNGDGIFYEGFRGYPDFVQINTNKNNKTDAPVPLVKIKTDARAVLDFGVVAI